MLCSYSINILYLFFRYNVCHLWWFRTTGAQGGVRAMTPNLKIYIFIYLIYLFIYLFIMLHILFINNLIAYILPCWLFCMLCFRGRAVANVGRTCSPTPLFLLIMYRGNKICLYYLNITFTVLDKNVTVLTFKEYMLA